MTGEVVTYYLEMTEPGQLRPAERPQEPLQVCRAEVPLPELNRFLYAAVGHNWHWMDRRSWSYGQWLAYLDRACLETWVGYVRGTPAGYFELEFDPEHGAEIVYFGVFPRFTGQGIGGALLTEAVKRAWQAGAARVWLHTCTLDHPAALKNYQARGFRLFREETRLKDLLPRPETPW